MTPVFAGLRNGSMERQASGISSVLNEMDVRSDGFSGATRLYESVCR